MKKEKEIFLFNFIYLYFSSGFFKQVPRMRANFEWVLSYSVWGFVLGIQVDVFFLILITQKPSIIIVRQCPTLGSL